MDCREIGTGEEVNKARARVLPNEFKIRYLLELTISWRAGEGDDIADVSHSGDEHEHPLEPEADNLNSQTRCIIFACHHCLAS